MNVAGVKISGSVLDRPSWRTRMMGVIVRAKILGHDLGEGPFSRRELLREPRRCQRCNAHLNLPMIERGEVRMNPCSGSPR